MTDTISPEVGKTYLTRNGRKARCICTDMLGSKYSAVCLVGTKGAETAATYTTDGRFHVTQLVSGFDLVSEAPRVVTVNVWVELTPDGRVFSISTFRFEPAIVGNTVVKITQDVELPNV